MTRASNSATRASNASRSTSRLVSSLAALVFNSSTALFAADSFAFILASYSGKYVAFMYCTAQYDANAGMHANVACHACQSHPNVCFARVCVSTCAAMSAKGGRLPLRTSERTDSLRVADDADVDGDDEDDEDA